MSTKKNGLNIYLKRLGRDIFLKEIRGVETTYQRRDPLFWRG